MNEEPFFLNACLFLASSSSKAFFSDRRPPLANSRHSPKTFLLSSVSFKNTFRAPLGREKAPLVFPWGKEKSWFSQCGSHSVACRGQHQRHHQGQEGARRLRQIPSVGPEFRLWTPAAGMRRIQLKGTVHPKSYCSCNVFNVYKGELSHCDVSQRLLVLPLAPSGGGSGNWMIGLFVFVRE